LTNLHAHSLDQLALRHGTDKGILSHGFTPIYDRLLQDWRRRPVTILELGVFEGASVRMWRDYFSAGRIVGVDNDPTATDHVEDRIKIYIGDQANPSFLERVAAAEGPFDLVVDDGGHRATQQKVSLRSLWPHLKPGGIYVIEDIHTSYLQDIYGMGWREPETTVEFLKYVVDDIHEGHHKQAVTLPGIESMHFYPELCVMRRAGAS
jgi:predicted O-methyltransferase YrrM